MCSATRRVLLPATLGVSLGLAAPSAAQTFEALGTRVYFWHSAKGKILSGLVVSHGEGGSIIAVSGGKPDHLLKSLAGSAVWSAALAVHARGGVLAGCSAGAMVLAGRQALLRRRMLPFPMRWQTALDVVPGTAVFPHYDRIPEPIAALMALQAPRGTAVIGIDEATALVGHDGAWQVVGRSRVTIWRGRHRTRYHPGDLIRL